MDRRNFIKGTAAAASLALASTSSAIAPNDKIAICVMGVRGRGGGLLNTFAAQNDVEVRYVCDLDLGVLKSRVAQVGANTGKEPLAITDYRHALDDKSLDAIVIGTPDHWHALPSIHACQAGKDVYVEKPDGHNILEGQTMVAAAKKYQRIVQLGTQSRSGAHQQSAIDYIRQGKLGKVCFAKAWESTKQGSIGHPADTKPPAGFDYNTWLGPAPKRPFNKRRWHSSWRWFFDYGTGDLGNDGVHRLDVARWGLETAIAAQGDKPLGMPRTISAHGGKYYFDDDQQWPDTMMVTYDYPGAVFTYELRIWNAYPMHGDPEGSAIYGDQGYVVIGNRRWRAFDPKGKQILEEKSQDNNVPHARNFLDCMRTRKKPNADLETVGHPSSLLSHLGNIAWRTGHTVQFDAATESLIGDKQADGFRTRPEYRKPWLLPKISEL